MKRTLQISLIVLITCLSLMQPVQAQAKRPNIILVFIDDMGWADLSCFERKALEILETELGVTIE